MTVVRPLPELSYATGITAKLTAQTSNMVRAITCSWRGHAGGVGRRHLFPEEILQIKLD
jgi:hypothetical protein